MAQECWSKEPSHRPTTHILAIRLSAACVDVAVQAANDRFQQELKAVQLQAASAALIQCETQEWLDAQYAGAEERAQQVLGRALRAEEETQQVLGRALRAEEQLKASMQQCVRLEASIQQMQIQTHVANTSREGSMLDWQGACCTPSVCFLVNDFDWCEQMNVCKIRGR
jgi:hypothetical protein